MQDPFKSREKLAASVARGRSDEGPSPPTQARENSQQLADLEPRLFQGGLRSSMECFANTLEKPSAHHVGGWPSNDVAINSESDNKRRYNLHGQKTPRPSSIEHHRDDLTSTSEARPVGRSCSAANPRFRRPHALVPGNRSQSRLVDLIVVAEAMAKVQLR